LLQAERSGDEGEIFVILCSKENKGLDIGGARLHFKRYFELIWKTQRTVAKYFGHLDFYKIHI
jgi:ssDNA-specific exonuclease RecJ